MRKANTLESLPGTRISVCLFCHVHAVIYNRFKLVHVIKVETDLSI